MFGDLSELFSVLQPANQNRFSQLDQTEAGSPSYYDGRGSGGRFRQQQERNQYGGRNSRWG